jgi:hypothetical protein
MHTQRQHFQQQQRLQGMGKVTNGISSSSSGVLAWGTRLWACRPSSAPSLET